ncbi:MAG: DegT/DnrJ/EryC1/StrS family aminotransferase [Planctomycetota bacterium]
MPVPFFDIHATLGPRDREAILARWRGVLEHGRFLHGPEVGEFESRMAAFLGVEHVVACSNGSDALVLCLQAVGIRPGDEVIVPAFTFFASAGAVARVGAAPVFADVDPETLNLSPEAAAAKVTPRTAAVLAVHLFGCPAPVAEIRRAVGMAAGRQVPVLEDAAQAVGAAAEEGPCGGMGLAAGFSCFPTKNLAALGDAGFVSTRDGRLAARVRCLREHGQDGPYRHTEVGRNARMDTLQAAVLLERLPQLLAWNAARQAGAARYRELLADAGLLDAVAPLRAHPGHVYHQFVVQVEGREALRSALDEAGVGTAVYYPVPLHLQPCFAPLGGREGDLPVCERAARRVLALPIHPGMTEAARREVVAALARILERAGTSA